MREDEAEIEIIDKVQVYVRSDPQHIARNYDSVYIYDDYVLCTRGERKDRIPWGNILEICEL